MTRIDVDIRDDERPELDAALGDRIYEFNADASGIGDARLLSASIEDDAGRLMAGLTGHTWGGCCEILRLWVHRSTRGAGIGTALMEAAEREAVRRGCRQIVLSTHSFQAPRFYERLGFRQMAVIPDYPHGHDSLIYVKTLPEHPPDPITEPAATSDQPLVDVTERLARDHRRR